MRDGLHDPKGAVMASGVVLSQTVRLVALEAAQHRYDAGPSGLEGIMTQRDWFCEVLATIEKSRQATRIRCLALPL